jgi:23S rRNA (adenine2503-C2)-methyltransferase
MDLAILDQALARRGEPRFRARQVWAWAARGAGAYAEMTDLPAALRAALAREVPFSSLTLEREARARDETVKALFSTADGRPLEAVLMRYRDGRRSLCVSSQSGCALDCAFCATGRMRFARNLTPSEILDQALHFRRLDGGAPLTQCVFMGMGEPMLNLDAVLAACERLPDLDALAAQPLPLRLALSIHAADEALRSELMPVNDRYPLADVLDAARAFYARKRRRVFVEYVMLAGVNDRYEQALALARLLARGAERSDRSIFKVNLIPYNPIGENGEDRFAGSSREAIAAFATALREHGVPATVRLTRGREIDAACGQLAARAA